MPVKAGDRAPSLNWTKVVASGSPSGGPQSLLGQITVLLFLRPVSSHEHALLRWNELVQEFAGKPVNFIWIANEQDTSLAPFLKSHHVAGWMVLDSREESYRAYGVEGAAGVLIDSFGTIAGFTFLTPEQEQIQAVLDGRAIAIQGDPTESQLDDFFEAKAVRIEAEPSRSPPPPQKPDLPPSDELHISPSTTEGTISSGGPDHWMRRGFDLRAVLSEISGTNPSRIELPAALDNGTRYDFILMPPGEEDEAAIKRQVRAGIENYFHVTIATEIRSVEVYILTAAEGKTPPRRSENDTFGGSFGSTWRRFKVSDEFKLPEGADRTRKAVEEANRRFVESPEFRQAMAMAQLIGMTALSSSMDDFCRALEEGLHSPVLDETGLTGLYDFSIQGDAQETEEFLNLLRNQLGLVLTSTERSIEMTIVRLVE